jgi:hypothetical protein
MGRNLTALLSQGSAKRRCLGISGRAAPLALLGALLALATPTTAQAEAETATVEVTVARADGDVEELPRAGSTVRGGRRGNFGMSMSAAQRFSLGGSAGASSTIRLPSGRNATLRFLGMQGSAYRISVTVPGGSAVITAPRGGVFYVNAGRHAGGTLVLILRF